MTKISALAVEPSHSLTQRLRRSLLSKQFSYCDSEVVWRNTNRLFLMLALPATLLGVLNLGYRTLNLAEQACSSNDLTIALCWNYQLIVTTGLSDLGWITYLSLGSMYFIPLLVVCFAACRILDGVFIRFFSKPKDGGNLLNSLLFVLLLPITIPLGYAVVGVSIGLVFGKLIFGGSGHYLVNPALLGVLFLSYSYPSLFNEPLAPLHTIRDYVPTTWRLLSEGGIQSALEHNDSWSQVLVGVRTNASPIGATSALASLVGLFFLLLIKKQFWRVPLGAILGLTVATLLLNTPDKTMVWQIGWHWHLVAGSFAFCLAFIATDPTVMPLSRLGKVIYGAFFGFLTVVIRIANPNHPEGTLMALLLASLLVPLIDWITLEIHRALVKKKRRLMI